MKNTEKLEKKLKQLENEYKELEKKKVNLSQQLHSVEIEIIQKSGAYKMLEELIKEELKMFPKL